MSWVNILSEITSFNKISNISSYSLRIQISPFKSPLRMPIIVSKSWTMLFFISCLCLFLKEYVPVPDSPAASGDHLRPHSVLRMLRLSVTSHGRGHSLHRSPLACIDQ